jgi:hypothetical protein
VAARAETAESINFFEIEHHSYRRRLDKLIARLEV